MIAALTLIFWAVVGLAIWAATVVVLLPVALARLAIAFVGEARDWLKDRSGS